MGLGDGSISIEDLDMVAEGSKIGTIAEDTVRVHNPQGDTAKASFTVDLSNSTMSGTNGGNLKLSIGGTDFSLELKAGDDADYGGTGKHIYEGDEIADAFVKSLTANADGVKTATIDGTEYKVTNDGGKLNFEQLNEPTSASEVVTGDFEVKLEVADKVVTAGASFDVDLSSLFTDKAAAEANLTVGGVAGVFTGSDADGTALNGKNVKVTVGASGSGTKADIDAGGNLTITLDKDDTDGVTDVAGLNTLINDTITALTNTGGASSDVETAWKNVTFTGDPTGTYTKPAAAGDVGNVNMAGGAVEKGLKDIIGGIDIGAGNNFTGTEANKTDSLAALKTAIEADGKTFTIDGKTYTAKMDTTTGKATFTEVNSNGAYTPTADKITEDIKIGGTKIDAGKVENIAAGTGNSYFVTPAKAEVDISSILNAGITAGKNFTIGDDADKIEITGTADTAGATPDNKAASLAAIKEAADGKDVTINNVVYTVKVDEANSKIMLTEKDSDGTKVPTAAEIQAGFKNDTAALATGASVTPAAQKDAKDVLEMTGDVLGKTTNVKGGVFGKGTDLAEADIQLKKELITEGSTLKVGDQTYTFRFSDNDTAYTGEGVVDVNIGKTMEDASIEDIISALTRANAGVADSKWTIGIGGDTTETTGDRAVDPTHTAANGWLTIRQQEDQTPITDKKDVMEQIEFSGAAAKGAGVSISLNADKLTSGSSVTIDGKTYEFVKAGEAAKTEGATKIEISVNEDGTTNSEATAKALQEAIGSKAELDGNKVIVRAETAYGAAPSASKLGHGLTLQVGETSEDFQKVTVNVSSMDAKSLGIGDIDISNQEGASAAIDKIKTAINTVSSTRGDLGAIQNRLEHTINNLGVTTENMTAAESRIRDTDMAKEMMEFTKNNILVQASQAMLAQANQLPQGVLQLLQ